LLTDDVRPPQDAGRISEVGASEFLATIVEGVAAPSKEEGAPEEKRPLFQVQTQMVCYGGIMKESLSLSLSLSLYLSIFLLQHIPKSFATTFQFPFELLS